MLLPPRYSKWKGKSLSCIRLFAIPGTIQSMEFSRPEYWSHLPFPSRGGSDGKASAYNVGDLGLILGSEGSPGEGNGKPLQYCYLGNPWEIPWTEEPGRLQSIASQSQTWLSDLTFFLSLSLGDLSNPEIKPRSPAKSCKVKANKMWGSSSQASCWSQRRLLECLSYHGS